MKSISRNKITLNSENTELDAKIYNARNDENFGIIDEGDYFVIYKIKNIATKIPSLNDVGFENEIRNFLFNKNKFEYNKKILKLINEGKFQESDFKKIATENTKIEKLLLDSSKDTKKFSSESIELIYSLPEKSFALVADSEKNIYLLRIIDQRISNISKDSELKNIYLLESNNEIKNKIFQSYDSHLNSKYDIKINEKTLERVKNYFR